MHPIITWRSQIAASDLPPTTRHVALTLALYMNERGGSAFPGADRLAGDTGLNVGTVRKHLGDLVEEGWLDVIEQGGIRGAKRRATEYAATTPPRAEDDPSSSATPRANELDPARRTRGPRAEDAPNRPGNSSGRTARAPKRRAVIPDPFVVTEADYDWAAEKAPTVDVNEAAEEFVTYWRGRGDTRADWTQTFRNRLLQVERLNRRRSA